MFVSYYMHAWQALLMFLAGIVSVLAAFAGYVQSGGGEDLLRRALVKLETGKAEFDSIHFNWKLGKMEVKNLRHDAFAWPRDNPLVRCSGLAAQTMTIQLDLLPWPPKIEKITVRGMSQTAIQASQNLLQSGQLLDLKNKEGIPPIEFLDCDLKLTIGDLKPVQLSGCSGELRRDEAGQLQGAFSLRQLNGRPFNFRLETLEGGKWIFTGDEIHLDTRTTLGAANPFEGRVDPVYLLVGALFSGQMGAEGVVSSVRVVVQPASLRRGFICEGEVGFNNLEIQLPPAQQQAGQALPFLLDQLLGAGENVWPRWMQVDRIRTGPKSRVSFHMAGGQLNFACDEGADSAFMGIRQEVHFPSLESLKGSVETDKDGNARQIVLRGFLGDELSFQTRIAMQADQSRAYELLLQPRAGNAQAIAFGKPLWRFAYRMQDYIDANPERPADSLGQRSMAEFEVEADVRHFPWRKLLPPGVADLSGHMYAKGRFTDKNRLYLETIRLDDDAELTYSSTEAGHDFIALDRPHWRAVQSLLGTATPWKIRDLSMEAKVEVRFTPALELESTVITEGKFSSGTLTYAGLNSDFGLADVTFKAEQKKVPETPANSSLDLLFEASSGWSVGLRGHWKNSPGPAAGRFTLEEENVPLALHPQREKLDSSHISSDGRRVRRTTEVIVNGGTIERDVR